MQDKRRLTKTSTTLIAVTLTLSGLFCGVLTILAAPQDDTSVRGKGLGNAKPIVIDAQPRADKDVRLNSGWKLFLVGTNRYDNMTEADDLRYAVKDVEALKSRFIQLGVPKENITILTTDSRGALIPEKKNIESAFQQFIASLERGDCAFVYLSGHGFRFANNDRSYYAPQNVVVTSRSDIIATSVSIDDMIDALQNSLANLKWMTVDACRNAPTNYLDDESAASRRAVEIGVNQHFIVDSSNLPETFVFMQGCEDGQFSIESPELEQGLMTYSLLEALQFDDNPVDKTKAYEIKLVDLLRYVQTRTNELAHMCHDRSNRPCAQKPAITNYSLQNVTFLTNLRHGGLTKSHWQLIDAEEEDFDNYLSNNDFVRAEDALETLVGYYPEGEEAARYQELKQRLEAAKKKPEADKCYELAKSALDAKEYAAAKLYIDEALALYEDPVYNNFRNAQLALAVKAAIVQAIANANATLAKSLNDILIDLDPDAARANMPKIAALNKHDPILHIEPGALKTLTIADVEVNFHWIPAGSFTMGSPESEIINFGEKEKTHPANELQHEVTLTQGFWMAENLTTQQLWLAVMKNNPSFFKSSKQLPVDSVSWNECRDFVDKLNATYANNLPRGYKFAMPTEAQWEYACRAGTTTPFHFGKALNGDRANCVGSQPYGTSVKGDYKQTTTPAGTYPPNAWGLFDMHGNLEEWCADWYAEDYYANPKATLDPTGPESGTFRVQRGGCWGFNPEYCRAAFRRYNEPDYILQGSGFRLAISPDPER